MHKFMSDAVLKLLKRHPDIPGVVLLLDSVEHIRGTSVNAVEVQGSVETLLAGHAEKLRDRQKYGEAESAYRESVELRRRLRRACGDTPQALRHLSISLNNLGDVLRDRQRLDEAESAYRESLNLRRLLRRACGDSAQSLRDLSFSLSMLVAIAAERGELAIACEACKEGLAIDRALHSAHATPLSSADLHWSLRMAAELERALGNAPAAAALDAELAALSADVPLPLAR
ncbi:MAG: tetratricopeptide repeat protein [Myxococcales bacterium]|nr:tetratricopeptide repeat protein [Myxococcales bacterium]